MKRIIYTLFVAFVLFLVPSCLEDPLLPDDIRNALPPELSTGDVSDVTATSVSATGVVEKKNGAPVTVCGFIWGTKDPVTFENMDDSMHVSLNDTRFSSIVSGLTNNTSYYIAAFAGNVAGQTVGSSKPFKTRDGLGVIETLPVLADSVKAESAIAGGRIKDPGEREIVRRGIAFWKEGASQRDTVWSTMQTDSFTCRLTGLTPHAKYFVLAIATNVFGTIEGNPKQEFTTPDGKAEIAAFDKLVVDYTYADFTATVSREGDAPVTERGFCYSTSADPTIKQDTVLCGAGEGVFTGRIRNLQANTTYYVRAYAVNNYGEAYSGTTIEVITKNDYPTVVLQSAELTATPGVIRVSGEVKDKGSSTIMSAGICWSTSTQNPVLGTENYQALTSVMEAFSGDVSGFKGGQTYYIRAYASNGTKTSYSKTMITITTPAVYREMASFTDGSRTPGSATSFMISNFAYFFGGDTGPAYTGKLWRYSDSEGMREMAANNDKMAWMSAVTVNLAAFVLGGRDESNQLTNNFYNYSGLDNQWTKLTVTSGPSPVARTMGCMLDMKLYFIGGIRKNAGTEAVSDEIWQYNVNTGGWSQLLSFPEPQYGGASFTYGNVLYAGFGITNLGTSPTRTNRLLKSANTAASWEPETTKPGGNVVSAVVHKNLLYVVDDARYIWHYSFATKTWTMKSQVPSPYFPVQAMYSMGDDICLLGMGTSKKLISYDPSWDL